MTIDEIKAIAEHSESALSSMAGIHITLEKCSVFSLDQNKKFKQFGGCATTRDGSVKALITCSDGCNLDYFGVMTCSVVVTQIIRGGDIYYVEFVGSSAPAYLI